jgi:hypothetical protein
VREVLYRELYRGVVTFEYSVAWVDQDVDASQLKAFCDEVKVEGPGVVGYNEALTKYSKKY